MRLRAVADEEGVYERSGRPIAEGTVRGRDLPKDELTRLVKDLESQMKTAAKDLEYEKAAALRDEIVELRGLLVLGDGPDALSREVGPPANTRRVMRRGRYRR
jgi:excinuclease ABC subunit B